MNNKLVEFNNYIKDKKVALIGLGVSNLAIINFLYNKGAKITAFDNKELVDMNPDTLKKLAKYQIELINGKDYLSKLDNFDLIFRSPSMHPDNQALNKAVSKGATVTTEIELFCKLCPATIIAVTGTDGKTTTTTLIHEILNHAGLTSYLGGNIGTPLLAKIAEVKETDYAVVELSSFQLLQSEIKPHIAVVTNLSPNHLDIHRSYEEYMEAKSAIFKYQTADDLVILNYDNEITYEFSKIAPSKVVFFSTKQVLSDGIYLKDNYIYDKGEQVLNTKDLKIKGIHNIANACTAIAATSGIVTKQQQAIALTNFKGIEHRLEFVRNINNVDWYNDSNATSVTGTIAGINSFDKNIVLIAGGSDKGLDYETLAKPITENVTKLILLGNTADKIEQVVKQDLNKDLPIYKVEDLSSAVNIAQEKAIPGEVVLLSPASASFDMFKNFAERGNKFKELVNKL